MILIADASAVGSFLLHDEASPFADFARAAFDTHDVHVPAIWPTELASLIAVAHRRGRLNDAQRNIAARSAEALMPYVQIVGDASVSRVVERASEVGLSVYDTTYLLLAERIGGAMLTGDGRLKRAAETVGLQVLHP